MNDAIGGWGEAHGSRKFHFYLFHNGMSLCGKFAWLGSRDALDTEDYESPDNCALCWRRRKPMLSGEEKQSE